MAGSCPTPGIVGYWAVKAEFWLKIRFVRVWECYEAGSHQMTRAITSNAQINVGEPFITDCRVLVHHTLAPIISNFPRRDSFYAGLRIYTRFLGRRTYLGMTDWDTPPI